MILKELRLEEKLKRYEGNPQDTGKDSGKLDQAGGPGEIGKLKNKLAEKDKELQAMKKQAEGLQREYSNLSDQFAKVNSDTSPKKDR